MTDAGRTAEERRGRLKLFVSYAPGAGKTCAMLRDALQQKGRGTDVAAGVVDPHGHACTARLLVALERLAGSALAKGGEMDLDAALARAPELVLVDDLAHRNAAGSRHSRRSQDVAELLKAGMDVYATVNVQHIESLSDAVAAVTGEAVRERIPDSVFDGADEVVFLDVEPAELIRRLGNAGLAIGQLTALREMALRRCADRLDRAEPRPLGPGAGLAEEHILACLSSAPSNARIIRTAARMAGAFHGDFTALYVRTPHAEKLSAQDQERLRRNMRLARHLGANLETVYGDDVAYQIAEFARLSGVSRIVLGRSAAGRRRIPGRLSLTDRLIAYAPSLDIHIIPDGAAQARYTPHGAPEKRFSFTAADALKCLLALLGATLLGFAFDRLGFGEATIIMAYLLAVLVTSVVTSHIAYSMAAAAVSVVAFNLLFIAPRFTLAAYGKEYPVTFLIMFLTACLSGNLAARLKSHARESAQTTYRTKVLFDTDQLLARAGDRQAVVAATAGQLVKLLGRDVVIYPAPDGEPQVFPAAQEPIADLLTEDERAVAVWAMRNNEHAGATTDTLSQAQCLYLAIRVGERVYGAVGVAARGAPLDPFEHSILLSILGECALALENLQNAAEKERAAVLAKNEQLRANMLRAISHDLRTPLTAISGNASNLLSNGADFDEDTRRQLYSDIYDDSLWLINVVENLLSVTRIEDGRMALRPSAELVEEIVTEALNHVGRGRTDHVITFICKDEWLMARADARLIVQVVVNIVDNALKYTPPGSHIDITAAREDDKVAVTIADDGPGVPPEVGERVFDMFFSGSNRAADSRRSLGLGLALCRSIITAHGGIISLSQNQPHGAVFRFTLPAEEVQWHE
ncbi:MAG TPA: sensor histidine kinase KdpD [Candidatus Limiplasma pullistercoris]|nr:sensor histidine kinase KdpD [Candidatus Limiplasma pullistercoris]